MEYCCNNNDELSWVQGNDVLLLAWMYEKVRQEVQQEAEAVYQIVDEP